ncbi:hypothetical protein FJZ26_02940, partial [Candidatus Parvarchaeota archaeon]|nr:hypothetical protein [Candidatus Parvarchaeota archaeon]
MRTNLSTLALAVFVALVFVQSSHALSLYLYAPLNNTFSGNDKIWFSYAVSSNSSCLFKVSKPDGQLVYSNSQANTWNWGGIIELSNGYYMWQVNCTSGNESAQSEVRYLVANATMGNNENGIVYLEPLNNTSVNNLSVALTYMANFTSSQNPSICVLNVLKFQSGYYFQVVTSETTVKLQPFYYSKIFNYEDGASYRWLVNCSYYDGEKWVRQPGAYRYFSVYAPGQASVSASILYPPEGSTMNAADSFMTFSASSSNGNPLTCNTYVGDQLESTYAVRSGMQATVYFTTSEGTKAIYVGCRVTNDTSFTFSDPRTVNFQKINISLLSPQNGTSFTSQNVELKYSAASTLKQPVNCTTFVDGVQKDFYPNLAFGTIRNFISTYTAGSHTWRVTCIMPGASPPTGTSQTSTFTVQQLNPPAADVKVALVFPENFSMFKASYYFPTALNYIANSSVAGSAITCISNLTKMGTGSTIQYTHSGTTPFRLFTYVSVPNGLYKWAVACNLSDGSTGTSESRIVGYNLSSGSDTWRIQNNFPENNENLNGQTVRFNFSGNFTGATNGNVYCGLRDSGRIAKANFEFAPPPQFSGSYSGIYNYGTGYNWYVNCTYFDGNSWVLQQGP